MSRLWVSSSSVPYAFRFTRCMKRKMCSQTIWSHFSFRSASVGKLIHSCSGSAHLKVASSIAAARAAMGESFVWSMERS